MSYKSILVQILETDEADECLRLAVNLANLFESRVIGVGAEPFQIPATAEYGYIDGALYQQMQDDIRARLKNAEARFHKLVGTVKGGISCLTEMDYPETVIARHARAADLVIASRPTDRRPYAVAKPSAIMMEAGRPVLLPPKGRDGLSLKNIVVAWKDTREARRAVADALPFLKQAKTVNIVGVVESSDYADSPSPLKDVAAYLDRHGIYSETETVTADKKAISECLHNAAERHGADLIVSGAYGHSRLREWVFGGVTSDFIDGIPKFVLFSH
jgi:nucleotide-binding universal stress UspA family protein